MAQKEQSVTLLRKNKAGLVAAIAANGYDVNETMRAADVAKYIRYGAGCDCTVAAVRKADGRNFYFTTGEWNELSYDEKLLFVLRGLRVRTAAADFIIAPDTLAAADWTTANDNCAAYRAFTEQSDGIDDATEWALPTPEIMTLCVLHQDVINAAWSAVLGSSCWLSDAMHWTSLFSFTNKHKFFHGRAATCDEASDSSLIVSRPMCVLKSIPNQV